MFGKWQKAMNHFYMNNEARTDNTGLAKVAVQCSADTFVVNQTLVLRINICGENRHLRQAAKRWPRYLPTVGNLANEDGTTSSIGLGSRPSGRYQRPTLDLQHTAKKIFRLLRNFFPVRRKSHLRWQQL